MNALTKELYEKLKPYEKEIKAAYKNSFVHMSGSEFLKVADIYAEINGYPLTKSQMNCNTCRLNTLRKLGELYCNYTEKKKEEEKKVKEQNEETPKKKTGRPKKLLKNDETN